MLSNNDSIPKSLTKNLELAMKIETQKLFSPPPKPPRRRYSDQLSVSLSGTLSLKKSLEGSHHLKSKTQLNVCSKSDCLSLPAKWTPDCRKETDYHRRHHSDPVTSCMSFASIHQSVAKNKFPDYCIHKPTFVNDCNKSFDSSNISLCKDSKLNVQEIKSLKDMNEKSCIDDLKRHTHEDCSDPSISGLLSNIYYAQKAKDQILEGRLKLALNERDSTVRELEDIINNISRNIGSSHLKEENSSDWDIKNLLNQIEQTQNPAKLIKFQRMLLSQLYFIHENKQDQLSHELRMTILERDNALEKVLKLEEENKVLKMCFNICCMDNKHWEQNILDAINQVMLKNKIMSSEIEDKSKKFRTPHNLFCYESNAGKDEINKKIKSNQFKTECFHCSYKSEEIFKLKRDFFALRKSFTNEVESRKEIEEKCLRLERLAQTLRKKLNGYDIGVPV